MSFHTCCAAGMLAAAAMSASSGLASATFTILTPASPNVDMAISDVSGDGAYAIGWQANATNSNMRATRWTADNATKTDLGLLTGRPTSWGTHLNYDGSIATADALDSGYNPRIFQWTAPSTRLALPFMGTGTYVYSAGISSDGSVIAGWGTTTASASPPQRPYRWTSATGATTVPLPSGIASTVSALPNYQYTRALSGNGRFIIADTINAPGVNVGFRYDATTGISTDIGQMQAEKTPELLSISNDGATIIGTSSYDFGPAQGDISAVVGFVWTPGGGFVNIGSLSGGLDCLPRYLSGDGNAILGTSGGSNFIWTAGSGIMNFDSFLATNGIDTLGMTDLTFSGISDDGRTIAGMGTTSGGDYRGWIISGATVPEPGSLALVVVGGMGFICHRKRAARRGTATGPG